MPDRRTFLSHALTAALGVLLPRALWGQDPQPKNTARRRITVYKSPTCDCCRKWIEHVDKETDWVIDVKEMDDVTPMKDQLKIPKDMRSCHTAVVARTVFEGHVPADLMKLLLDRPRGVYGLAVPGMPVGTPGMEIPGQRADRYNVVGFYRDGRTFIFASR
ncbi:MAG TPA: DUF411 domain-containing protein [Gemmatimonadaceae bacterium]|nr:DUF411 domain-containing protein [Gemmatimonadaceae bacterium]